MLPRWFRAAVAAELIAVVALVVIGVHIALAGARAAGEVISWGRQQAGAGVPPAPAIRWSVPSTPSSHAGVPPAIERLGGPLLQRLDADTALTARGELSLIDELETMLRDRIDAVLAHVAGR